MLAVALTAPEKLEQMNRNRPTPRSGEVLVRVKAAGIGGTDMRIFKGVISAKLPLVLGQEFAGVVEEIGSGISGFSVGDRVSVEPVLRDNTCEYCKKGRYNLCADLKVFGIHLDGGYAESIAVPEYTLHKLPDRVTFEAGALVVPAAVAVYAVSRAESIRGSSVMIMGAGPIGLSALQIARWAGASKTLVSEPLESRRNLAMNLGATKVSDSGSAELAMAVKEFTEGEGIDVVIEATGIPESVDAALSAAKKAGEVIFAGAFGKPAQVNMGSIVRKDLTVRGSWLYPNRYSEALGLISDSTIDLKDMITHRFKLAEASEAFRTAQEPGCTKAIFVS